MQHLLPLDRSLLFDQVQVTSHSLRQAHTRLLTSLALLEQVAAVRSNHCKQALKTVHTMGELAASLHASLLTQDDPASLTSGLRLRLGVFMQYTNKAAMQLVLVQFCCRRNAALAPWLHQQACTYLDMVLYLSQQTLRELARVATQLGRAASDERQQESVARGDGTLDLLVPGSRQAWATTRPPLGEERTART